MILFSRFFDEIFSHVLSTKNLIEYINDIEYILFDRNSNNKINFDSNNDKFYQVAQQLINDLIPGKNIKIKLKNIIFNQII